MRSCLIFILLWGAFANLVYATGLPFDLIQRQVSSIPYDSGGVFAMGDGIEISKLDVPKGNCIDLGASNVSEDIPGGTVSVEVSIDVISTVSELETKLNRSLGVEASVNGNYLKVASGSASTKFTKDYEKFLDQTSSSLIVSIRMNADHGRDVLDYVLKDEYKSLLNDENYEDFRNKCGTHFIRAVQKVSYLEYNVVVNGLSRLEKETLKKLATTSLEGKGSFGDVFSVGGKVSTQEGLTRFVKTSIEMGTVNITADLVGAPGISALATSMVSVSASDADSVNKLFDNLSKIASSFKDSKGAPNNFLLLAYNDLPEYDVNFKKFYVINELTRKLLLVLQAKKSSEEIKTSLPNMWSDYFETDSLSLDAMKKTLLALFTDCHTLDDCQTNLPKDYEPLTINDVLFDGDLTANCGMDILAELGGEKYRVMSDMAVFWRGYMRFPNYISLSSVEAYYLDKDLNKIITKPFDYQYDYSVDPNHLASNGLDDMGNRRKGPARSIFQIVNNSFDVDEVLISDDTVSNKPKDTMDYYGDSLYGVKFRFKNGWVVNQLLGKPDLRQCRTMARVAG